MISGYDTNERRILQDHLENAKENLQSEAFIVEKVTEKNNSRPRSALPAVAPDQHQGGFESEQVAVQVADEPERVFRSYLSDANRLVTGKRTVRIEQHPATRAPVEPALHPGNNPAHATPHAADIDAVAKGDPIEVYDLDDRRHRRRRRQVRFVVGAAPELRHLRRCLPALGRSWRISCRNGFVVCRRLRRIGVRAGGRLIRRIDRRHPQRPRTDRGILTTPFACRPTAIESPCRSTTGPVTALPFSKVSLVVPS